jgi:rare lipoprotein A
MIRVYWLVILLLPPTPCSIPPVWVLYGPEADLIADQLPADAEFGHASYYGDDFIGRKTASGEHYQPHKMTAAHPSRPFGQRVRVCRQNRPRHCVIVRVNDRGPFVPGRIIDLSHSAAQQLGLIEPGLGRVMVHAAELP